MELTEPRGSETNRQQTMSSSINNSTRMELTAAIIATYAPRPITIGIDNLEGFKRIMDTRDKPTRWINKPDEDLWPFWEEAIVVRGLETIPGHQTQQDQDNGKISKYDRRGNAIADELAGYASQNHNQSMAKYAQETVRRYDECRKLVHPIHKYMLRVTNRIRGSAQIEQKIASTAETRRKPNIATFPCHKQLNRTTKNIRFVHDRPAVRHDQHQNVYQAMIQYLQRREIAEEQYAMKEDSRFMPVELLIDFESTTRHYIPENLKIYVQDRERRHSPRLTSVMSVINIMMRDIAANNIHPEDGAIFSTTTTVQCNATKLRHCEEAASVRHHRATETRQDGVPWRRTLRSRSAGSLQTTSTLRHWSP